LSPSAAMIKVSESSSIDIVNRTPIFFMS
jgi:hypothetical protein